MKITKPSIKRFSLVSFIYSTVFAIIFTVLLIIALLLPDTASQQSVMMLVVGELFCLFLCAVVIWHYCFTVIYEAEKTNEGILLRSLLKKHLLTSETNFTVVSSGGRCLIKIKPGDDNWSKTLILYKDTGFKSRFFTDEEIDIIKSRKENTEVE